LTDDSQQPSDPRIRFLIALGRALHSYGIPAHRLEDALGNAARSLGIRGEFFSGPTSLISSFGEPGRQHTALSRVQPGSLQLDKLVQLDEVVESLYRGEIGVEEADRSLHQIDGSPTRYGPVLTTLGFGVISCGAARVFGGGTAEMGVSLLLGLITGVLAVLAGRHVALERVFEFLVAMTVTFLAMAFSIFARPVATGEIILASLIILLPGLTLTLAMNELATGHLVSGTARFTGALMSFLKIGLGVGMGQRLALFLPGQLVEAAHPMLPAWTLWASLLITPLALVVLFRARWKEAPWILLGSMVAFWGARLGVDLLGAGLGAVVGALLAGLAGNLFARWQRHPAVVLVVPSIILLVPGSIGYRSLSLMMDHDVMSGVGNAFEALLVGVSLVAGLLLANVLLPPRNAL
jgi:uncharacterized membrane protein YjjP (DUF1212 family)